VSESPNISQPSQIIPEEPLYTYMTFGPKYA